MCGSGTTNIEASLMGINSYAIDLSPFCQLMTKVKYNSLKLNKESLYGLANHYKELFSYFEKPNIIDRLSGIKDIEKHRLTELSLLAYLDALGYSMRVSSSNHLQLFQKVLKRYEVTVYEYISRNSNGNNQLGEMKILEKSTATEIDLKNSSIDGIITSPPYSFAIDYVENDKEQLNYLRYDIKEIRNKMIGLKGKNKDKRLNNYFIDMDIVCSEAERVLKPSKYFVVIIGSNTNQTGGIRLENRIIESCKKHNLHLVKSILKPIKGMRNTMKDEYILFFQKENKT
ncbi:MAG: hypothetical protein KA059_07550 [Elusimicrobiales bacterium]|nr:hypothetical protein [Elusimicrobiales bacterium]